MTKLNPLFHLFAYKPDSDETCRGCHMQSYSSDFIHEKNINLSVFEGNLIQICKENQTLDCQETGYIEIEIFKSLDNGASFQYIDPLSAEYNDLMCNATARATQLVKEEQEQKKQLALLDELKKLQEKELREKLEYQRLKSKFESSVNI
jgi:hypothetical protein